MPTKKTYRLTNDFSPAKGLVFPKDSPCTIACEGIAKEQVLAEFAKDWQIPVPKALLEPISAPTNP